MTDEMCEIHHPRPGLAGCEICGLPGDAHPFVAGAPDHPFDPCPQLENPDHDERLRQALRSKGSHG